MRHSISISSILQVFFVTRSGKQGSDCRDAQVELCEPASASVQALKAGERLLHAQPHCVYGTLRNGSMKWEVARNVAAKQELHGGFVSVGQRSDWV